MSDLTKRHLETISLVVILFGTGLFLTSCCGETEPTQINFWTGWTSFVGLLLTWTAFRFKSKCRKHYRDINTMGMKVHHIIWIACGYVWVFGMIFGAIMWIVIGINLLDDWELDEKAYPRTKKFFRWLGNILNKKI